MFSRPLSEEEAKLIERMADFVRSKHKRCEGHDHTHVLLVAHLAIEIAQRLGGPVDPFVLIAGALFHDIGRVGATTGSLHGLAGAGVAYEFLRAVLADEEVCSRVARVVARHTPTSRIPPETLEEKIVYDADTMERFGWIGVLRGVMGRTGSIEDILQTVIRSRAADYGQLLLPESREMALERHHATQEILEGVEEAMRDRDTKLATELPLPR
jgi:uncharacterized protein